MQKVPTWTWPEKQRRFSQRLNPDVSPRIEGDDDTDQKALRRGGKFNEKTIPQL